MRNEVCIEAESQTSLNSLCDQTATDRGFQYCWDVDRYSCS